LVPEVIFKVGIFEFDNLIYKKLFKCYDDLAHYVNEKYPETEVKIEERYDKLNYRSSSTVIVLTFISSKKCFR